MEAPSTWRKKPGALPLALGPGAEQLEGLGRHRREARLGGRPLALQTTLRGAGAAGRRRRAAPFDGHVAAVEQAQDAIAGLGGGQAGRVGHVGVAGVLGLVDHRLAGIRPAGDRLLVAGAATAEDDVDLAIDRLLGDRARAAVLLGVLRAVGHVGGTLARACLDVGHRRGRRGVGDLGGRHVAGQESGRFGEVDEVRHVGVRTGGGGDAAVGRLLAGRPGRRRGRRFRVVVRRRRVALEHRVCGHLTGELERVDGQPTGRADRVVTGAGDLGRAHPVTDEQDHVACLAGIDGLAQLLRLGQRGSDRDGGERDRQGGDRKECGGQATAGHHGHLWTGRLMS